MTERFDRWVASGPFTARDLGRYRIVFAFSMLAMLPDFQWVGKFPDSLYAPPPGPFSLFGGFPSTAVLGALELALAVALAFLLFGVGTRFASVAVTLLLIAGYGFTYSLGKIDHTILQVLTPLVLSFGAWGSARSRDGVGKDRWSRPPPQWPLRFLALLIGLGFLTAAAPKLLSGWLAPATQAVRGTLFGQYFVNNRTELLADFFLGVRWVPFWESLDWVAVLLEAVLLLTVLNWRLFRCGLALTALFHVGVYLMMNIHFEMNVLVYGAFVAWGGLRLPRPAALPASVTTAAPALAVGLGVTAWVLTQWFGNARPILGPVIVMTGGVIALVYLFSQVRRTMGANRQVAP